MVYELINKLTEKSMTVATAESCTGGMLAAMITDVPGSSACFNTGVITYSNKSKMQLLNVNPETLEKYGAVSSQTALEMSEGIVRLANADVGLSATGIAGPGGSTKDKPVGLVYISLFAKDLHQVHELRLSGSRDEIRKKTTEKAMKMLLEYMEKV